MLEHTTGHEWKEDAKTLKGQISIKCIPWFVMYEFFYIFVFILSK